jgi:hypothetical protein
VVCNTALAGCFSPLKLASAVRFEPSSSARPDTLACVLCDVLDGSMVGNKLRKAVAAPGFAGVGDGFLGLDVVDANTAAVSDRAILGTAATIGAEGVTLLLAAGLTSGSKDRVAARVVAVRADPPGMESRLASLSPPELLASLTVAAARSALTASTRLVSEGRFTELMASLAVSDVPLLHVLVLLDPLLLLDTSTAEFVFTCAVFPELCRMRELAAEYTVPASYASTIALYSDSDMCFIARACFMQASRLAAGVAPDHSTRRSSAYVSSSKSVSSYTT